MKLIGGKMKSKNRHLVVLLLIFGFYNNFSWAGSAGTDQNDANKILFDLQKRAKIDPESKGYVFSVEYIGSGNPQIECDYVVVYRWIIRIN